MKSLNETQGRNSVKLTGQLMIVLLQGIPVAVLAFALMALSACSVQVRPPEMRMKTPSGVASEPKKSEVNTTPATPELTAEETQKKLEELNQTGQIDVYSEVQLDCKSELGGQAVQNAVIKINHSKSEDQVTELGKSGEQVIKALSKNRVLDLGPEMAGTSDFVSSVKYSKGDDSIECSRSKPMIAYFVAPTYDKVAKCQVLTAEEGDSEPKIQEVEVAVKTTSLAEGDEGISKVLGQAGEYSAVLKLKGNALSIEVLKGEAEVSKIETDLETNVMMIQEKGLVLSESKKLGGLVASCKLEAVKN